MKELPIPDNQKLFLGRLCERAAGTYLNKKGWRVVGRNVRSKMGEVDLIAEDKKSHQRWVVEVRGRVGFSKRPVAWLAPQKVARLKRLAMGLVRLEKRGYWILFIEMNVSEKLKGKALRPVAWLSPLSFIREIKEYEIGD